MKRLSFHLRLLRCLLLCLLLVLCASSSLLAQSVPITFHYRPTIKTFTTLRLVGSMNGWNNADNAMTMTDPDGDGEYGITISLAAGTDYAYKFCMDANWSFAYGDPDNPRINTADNDNSMILVKNPMITYLLPRDKDSKNRVYVDTSKNGLPIRLVIAASADKPIDPASIVVSIDGTPLTNAAQYYNSTTKEFLYQPVPSLPVGDHTVMATVTSPAGSDSKTATFTRNPNQVTYRVPVDFYYDQNNASVVFAQQLTGVAVVGSFNNWNDQFNPMSNMYGNGVWETTVLLEPDSIQYKFKLNQTAWINDPDMPTIDAGSGNNRLVVRADTIASVKLLAPMENQTFTHDTTVTVTFLLRAGAKSKGVDAATVSLLYDGTPASFTVNPDSTATASIAMAGDGRHTVECVFKNKEGAEARQLVSYGISTSKGVYAVTGIGNEQYAYPAGVTSGAADILSVAIHETAHHDSLRFTIQMRAVDVRTRIGLLITNPVAALVNDPRQLEIQLPDWNGQGVFASIGVPGNPYQNILTDNRFMISNSPAAYSADSIAVNADAVARQTFEFTVSLAFLGRYMGGWTDARQFSVFSYLAATDASGNGYEVGPAEGGSTAAEDPDVYDAAFIRSNFWQRRLLSNYLPGNPHFTALDGNGRGLLPLTAGQISDSLASRQPYVTFLTPPADYWYPAVTIHGTLTDSTFTTLSFVFNGAAASYPVAHGRFDIPVTLAEGRNTATVKIVDTAGVTTTSKELVLMYVPDKRPTIRLSGTVNGRNVSLSAAAASPIGEALSYAWSADATNPAAAVIASTTNAADVTLPAANGEYIFTATATDAKTNSAFAKIAVRASGDSVFVAAPDDNYHAAWIDSAIVYEIFPRSFSQQGGFQGITANIARITALGANTVWLMPVFQGPTVHGYETTDYYSLESDYGTVADFTAMIAAFKQNGLRVILDLVINHTGVTHPFMQSVFKYKEYSPWANFYIWSGEPGASAFAYFFDWSSLPNLNYDNPDVRKYVIDVSKYWVQQFGIDGWRCDVAWGVEQRNPAFWNEWRAAVKGINPDVYLLAEASSSDSTFYRKRFDSAYDWDLRTLLIGVLNGSTTLGSMHAQAVRPYGPDARPFRFIENHDETRATSMFDSKRSLLLHTVALALNGIPLIYAGAEVGESTQRDMINWTDPNHMQPYFARLVKIRKEFIHTPVIQRVMNSDTASIYTIASVSGSTVLLTAANFKNTAPTVTLDLTTLPFDGTSVYYLTDLFTGTVYTVQPTARKAVSVALTGYEARMFNYGLTAVDVTSVENNRAAIPTELVLEQNFPNPFNPSTTIRYAVPVSSRVTLQVYNVLGQVVAALIDGEQSAGWHETVWNASAASGLYFYRLEVVAAGAPRNRSVLVKKLLLLK